MTYLGWRLDLIERALTAEPSYPKGLAGFWLAEADYVLLEGNPAPFVFPVEPNEPGDPAAGANAEARQIHAMAQTKYKALLDIHHARLKSNGALRQAFINALDKTTKAALSDPIHGYTRLSERQLLAAMDVAYGTITVQELRQAKHNLEEQFVEGASLREHIAVHKRVGAFAAACQQPMPETEKVSLLRASVQSSGLFEAPIQIWEAANPGINQQRFDQLALVLQQAADTRGATLTVGNRQRGEAQSLMANLASMVTELTSRLDNLAANAASAHTTPSQVPTNNRPRYPPAKFYCWTHGSNPSHASCDCRYPAQGHKKAATASNKLGGKI